MTYPLLHHARDRRDLILQGRSEVCYPNPTTTIQRLKVNTEDVVALEVYDALGRKVFVSKDKDGMTTESLPSSIKESVYKVKLITEKSSTTQTLQIK